MTKVTITYEQLKSKRACEDGLELFKETFPNGISVTSKEELVAIAKKYGKGPVYIYWAAEKLLLENYYDKYLEVKNQAYDKHLEVKNQAYIECKIVKQLSDDEYKIVKQQARDEYLEVRAIVFAELYYQQESTKVEGS
jgi:hypothetical protein